MKLVKVLENTLKYLAITGMIGGYASAAYALFSGGERSVRMGFDTILWDPIGLMLLFCAIGLTSTALWGAVSTTRIKREHTHKYRQRL